MTIATDLFAALSPVAADLVAELGLLADAKRAVTTRAADNSAIQTWQVITGTENGLSLAMPTETAARRQQLWGQESTIDATGYVATSPAILEGDLLIPRTGSFAGVAFEVVRRIPLDMGGLVTLGLKRVPTKPDAG